MIGKLKASGAILIAVLAVSAFGASAAQAEGLFEAEEYPVALLGEETETLEIESELGTMKCKEVDLTGEMTGNASMISGVPDFEGCTLGAYKVEVFVTGCELAFHGGKEIAEEEFESTMDVACGESEAAEIAIHIPLSNCVIRVVGQAGLGKLFIKPGGFFPPDLVIGIDVAKVDAILENTGGKKCGLGAGKLPLAVYGGLTISVKGISPTVGLRLR